MRSEAAELTYLRAAAEVLRQAGRPLSAPEIVDRALADGLLPNATTAKTPQKSMQARLSMHILRKGSQSTFVRTSAGRFQLRASLKAVDERPIESFDRNMHRERA
ncbi:winged helix-turn-helix domain-containing protein [Methylobacterium planeticum]|uniref:HTH HARE-type domain-containing protein n=1 Tax=Methylobacterium planeticum TaxID=2615211 RepID=A0A6N6MJA9_9HYPH|nr:winged helix-turn-helix domain-containing protein [Methylobacterium planeticum]KAB1069639.1 hypothetical protein F6X51_24930 [Methylobacterium planeticum]